MTPTNTCKIILTDRAPVRIVGADWPVIAEAGDGHPCGEQAQNGFVDWAVKVRKHSDGRILVYAWCEGACQCDLHADECGELLAPGADIPAAIRRVTAGFAATQSSRYGEEDRIDGARLARACIAELPAETI